MALPHSRALTADSIGSSSTTETPRGRGSTAGSSMTAARCCSATSPTAKLLIPANASPPSAVLCGHVNAHRDVVLLVVTHFKGRASSKQASCRRPERDALLAANKKEQGTKPCSKNCVDPISPQS